MFCFLDAAETILTTGICDVDVEGMLGPDRTVEEPDIRDSLPFKVVKRSSAETYTGRTRLSVITGSLKGKGLAEGKRE